MKRREFISLVGSIAAWPLTARAQPAMPVIGYLSARSAQSDVPLVAAFRQGLLERGYAVSQNVAIEYRWVEAQFDRLPALVEDLVHRQVAIIVTSRGENVALAAKTATTTIPIVYLGAGDPVKAGLVASFSRPGGNVTGITTLFYALTAKQIGLLHELLPMARNVGILVDLNSSVAEIQISDAQSATRSTGQQLIVLKASTEDEIDVAFTILVQQHVGALVVAASPFYFIRADRIIAQAALQGVPAIYFRRELVEAGGLMSYGSTTAENYRQLGVYAGRILQGEKPSDLPIMQPTKFELLFNLKTAKALGLAIPPTLLATADDVIE